MTVGELENILSEYRDDVEVKFTSFLEVGYGELLYSKDCLIDIEEKKKHIVIEVSGKGDWT